METSLPEKKPAGQIGQYVATTISDMLEMFGSGEALVLCMKSSTVCINFNISFSCAYSYLPGA